MVILMHELCIIIYKPVNHEISNRAIPRPLVGLTGDAGVNPNRGHNPPKLWGMPELALATHMRSRPGITLA